MKMKPIQHVTVLGSGVMGSQIALHLANAGIKVALLDILPKDEAKGRNSVAQAALKAALKMKPEPAMLASNADLITCGNLDDDLPAIQNSDWIIEVVVERLDIKQQLFEKVDKLRKEGSYISSNTSGIPMHLLIEGRSDDFKQHFLGTHFFNPPRYLELLELIPTEHTNSDLLEYFQYFGTKILGKTTVVCKDTPAFIANRVGVFSIAAIFKLMEKYDLSFEEVDLLTGPISGRPKSATFRTCDVVGIDTLLKVTNHLKDALPNDERADWFHVPEYISNMVDSGMMGQKTNKGFYQKDKKTKEISVIIPETLEYRPIDKPKYSWFPDLKEEPILKKKLRFLWNLEGKEGDFLRELNAEIISYAINRVPEISDDILSIDNAIKAGFGWEMGPFETADAIGVQSYLDYLKKEGKKAPNNLSEILGEKSSFYSTETEEPSYIHNGKFIPKPASLGLILDDIRKKSVLWKNGGASIHDIGDQVLCVEFHSKMNTMGGDVLSAIQKGIAMAEEGDYRGLVIGNQASNFSAGANLGLVYMLALEQEYDELEFAIRQFQQTTMRARHSSIPVVVAPHHLTLGGGCELSMHADKVVAAAETYIGLVEVGVGVIPGGGGCKEWAARLSDESYSGDTKLPRLQAAFESIATAKVCTSADQAFDLGIFREGQDRKIMNAKLQIQEAKAEVIRLSEAGYVQPHKRTDIEVMGRSGLAGLRAGVASFGLGHYASEHDMKIGNKVAYVLCGGDLSYPQQVSEDYLLNLEREAFLSLLGERKTLERIKAVLTTGKPIRN